MPAPNFGVHSGDVYRENIKNPGVNKRLLEYTPP
jgi:hypothetical protein